MSRRITPPAPPVELPPGTTLLTIDVQREYAISEDDRAYVALDYFGCLIAPTKPVTPLTTVDHIRAYEERKTLKQLRGEIKHATK